MPHFHHHHRRGGGRPQTDTGPSLPMPDETSSELRYLEPSRVQFRKENARFLFRESPGDDWQPVALVRLFPLTEPDRWISLVARDGREIGIIRDASKLLPAAADTLRQELRRRYLVPQIKRIISCRPRADATQWKVETDRGTITFLTRHLREQVKEPLPRRLTIVDIEGNRYDIADIRALDPDSRRRLELQI